MDFENILIVDDCEPDQFLVKILLESLYPRINVMQAYDGQEALDMISDSLTQPDVILLDINMPRMDGHEFLKEYYSNHKDHKAVFMLTSSYEDSDKEKALAYDFVEKYLTKPLTKEKLDELFSSD